ncbi:hypothetical protein [Bombilactobacillus thymidiniphilus]|uniref:Gas vesicle protein n=1 Tax=Bombilactobacillus thymidiniphilus TaxID=2923363 RepID=A0ABY4PCB7_9LACO|nr:hypothetical protein [Bombilactobacillus thymidiniphilus]UQS83342.1 hypothetical protein MOO47_06080 [Bombilactobacillus thymidiniphilus]
MKHSFKLGLISGSASVIGGIFLLKRNAPKIQKITRLKGQITDLLTEVKEDVIPTLTELKTSLDEQKDPIMADVQNIKTQASDLKEKLPL